MRAPISCQSKICLHKMADLQGQLNSPEDVLLQKQNRLSSLQRNLLDNFLLLVNLCKNYWIIRFERYR